MGGVDPATGMLFAVVGRSGVGKDSVINHARAALACDHRVLFVRRVISRPADSRGEDHDPVTEDQFRRLLAEGAFCAEWQAHGLHYGIPTAVLDHVETGGVAIVNGSRQALDRLFDRFPHVQVVEIVADPEVIAARLAARGRETAEQIAGRLRRSVPAYRGADTAVTIDNSGPLAIAGDALADLVRARLSGAVARLRPVLTNPG
ncbi:phosphonate metabolism protein/1,5-bisphosphokinase (PRPP-forming) PhnN [Oceaniradius stylonematis]|nr:phosphonate metabolism protein/1,5-bisphosphokinase (PRPP-forming) PhnN [Oceaniradius stylonematis]